MEIDNKYHKKGVNDLNLPKRIMRFIVDNAELSSSGQGVIGIKCDKFWYMSERVFEATFGVKLRELHANNDENGNRKGTMQEA